MMQKRNGRGQAMRVAKGSVATNELKPHASNPHSSTSIGSSAAFIDDELKEYNEKLMDDIRKAMDASYKAGHFGFVELLEKE